MDKAKKEILKEYIGKGGPQSPAAIPKGGIQNVLKEAVARRQTIAPGTGSLPLGLARKVRGSTVEL